MESENSLPDLHKYYRTPLISWELMGIAYLSGETLGKSGDVWHLVKLSFSLCVAEHLHSG